MSGKRVKQFRKIARGELNHMFDAVISEAMKLPFFKRLKLSWMILKGERK